MKKCSGCQQTKPKSEFYASNRVADADGLNRYCTICCKVNRALEGVRKRDKKSKMSMRQRHRATTLGVECDHTITLVEVFRISFGSCQICGEWVKPGHASMDHTHPLSKGGTHTWDNVQLVHLICNLRKSNKVDYQA